LQAVIDEYPSLAARGRRARSRRQGLRIEFANRQALLIEVLAGDRLNLLGGHLLQFFDQALTVFPSPGEPCR